MLKKIMLLTVVPFCLQAASFQAASLQEAIIKTEIVFTLLRKAEDSPYIGEAVTQQQHALQAAFHAQQKQKCDEFIIAALLHDIGHQFPGQSMDGWGIEDHEELGAQFLQQLGFSETICRLVKGHITAKRYLCATDPAYYAQLSDASKQTLTFQGAGMSKKEQELFEQDPLFEAKIALRHCDDLAKDPHAEVPPLEAYKNMVIMHLLN